MLKIVDVEFIRKRLWSMAGQFGRSVASRVSRQRACASLFNPILWSSNACVHWRTLTPAKPTSGGLVVESEAGQPR